MTPLQIEMLLNVYASPTPEANMLPHRWNSPNGIAFQKEIIDLGLATFDGIEWAPTERLKAYIEHLSAQALPVQKTLVRWVQP